MGEFWFKMLLLTALVFVMFFCYLLMTRCAVAGDGEADFFADAKFIRWADYACSKSGERGLNAVTMIEAAAKKVGIEDWGKLVCVAWYESRFKTNAVSRSGRYRGMLQIGSMHKAAMEKMGLDYYCEADRLEYGCWLYKWHGLQPWSVRNRARRDYKMVIARRDKDA